MRSSHPDNKWIFGGHRGSGCTDHEFYQTKPDIGSIPVENTLDSIVQAFRDGAGYVEFDAVPTADGNVIIIHNVVPGDHFFGQDRPPAMLNTMSYVDISAYRTGRNGRGVVPLISDICDAVAAHAPRIGDFDMNIEIKGVQGSKQPYETDAFLANLAERVRASAVPLDRVLFSSFSFENILAMSHIVPEARYGMLFNEKTVSAPIYADHQDDPHYRYLPFDVHHVDEVRDSWAQLAHPDARLLYAHPETATITPEMVGHLAKCGLGINAWDFMRRFSDDLVAQYKDVHALCQTAGIPVTFITDSPGKMRRAIEIG